MANGNLIQGARRIGQARRFVDYGKIIGDNIKSPALTQYFEEARAQHFQNIKEKEAKLASFINQKAYMDTSKINEYNVDMASDFLSNKKAEYLDAANIAATASVGSDEYVNAVSTMNAANNAIKNFDVELQAWRQLDAEQTGDFDKNAISKGNLNYGDIIETMQDPKSENGPSFIVNDNGKVTMVIRDAEGNIIKELERQEYFLKANEKMMDLSKIGDAFYNMGGNNSSFDQKIADEKIHMWLGEDHTKLLSLARDSFLDSPAMIKDQDLEVVVFEGLTGRELLQKNNQVQLKKFLAAKYGGVLKDRHTTGLNDYIRKNPPETGTGDSGSSISKSLRESSVVAIDDPTAPVGYSSYEEFYNDDTFQNDKERNAYLNEKGVRKLENTEKIETSNLNYANKLTTLLNAPRYGRQFNIYLSRDELVREVLQNEDQFEARGIIDSSDTEAALKFVKANYGDGYLYSYKKDQGSASMQVIPIDVFAEEDTYIDALLAGSDAIDGDL